MDENQVISVVNECLDGLNADTNAEKEWYISLPVKDYIERKAIETFIRAHLNNQDKDYSFTPLNSADGSRDIELVATIDTPEHERKRLGFK